MGRRGILDDGFGIFFVNICITIYSYMKVMKVEMSYNHDRLKRAGGSCPPPAALLPSL